MAANPTFMNFLTQASPGSVGSTQKKNPYSQTAATAPTPGNSPVTPTGQVNPSAPPQPKIAAQPQQQAQQQPPPTPDPFTSMGGGVYNYQTGGWVPKNHPAAQQAQQTQPQGGGGGGTGSIPNMPAYAQHFAGVQPYQGTQFSQYQNMTYDPSQLNVQLPQQYGTYNPYQVQTQLPGQGYQAGNFGTTPFTQYNGNPGNISQFQGPQTQQVQGQEQALLSQMLANPYSMSAQNVAQLKEKQKETALALQNSGMAQNAELAAAQGRMGGGNQALQDALLRDKANTGILNSYRDIDLSKMSQDRADLLDALGAANTSLNSASGRATNEFASQLAGQQAREQVGLNAATSAQAAERLGLDRTGMQEDARFRQAQSAQDLARLGLSADTLRQGEQQFAFNTEQQRFQDALKALGLQTDVAQFNAGENFKGYQSAMENQAARLAQEKAQAGDSQAAAQSGMTLAGMLQSGWDADQARQLQAQLGNRGLDIDQSKIGSNEKIAKMDNSTRLMDILLSNQLGRAQLGQQGQQFNQTFGLDKQKYGLAQQGQDNSLMQWLIENGY